MKNLVRPLLVIALLLALLLILAACERNRPAPAPAGTATRAAAGTAGPGTQVAPASATSRPAVQATPVPVGPGTPQPPTPQPLLPAPTSAATSVATTTTGSATYFLYTVAPGDSLNQIARRFKTTPDSIMALNQMTSPDVLSVGQQLKIPGEAPPELGGYSSYTVQSGDTLSSIARTYNISVADLQKLNGITNPDLVTPGQVLKVPGIVAASTPAPAATAGATVAPTSAPLATPAVAAPAGATTTYTVQRGDTLSAIARRYGVTTAQLMALNGISNPDRIYTGQVLKIPAGSAGAPQGTGRTHVVQAGETLYQIATRYGVTAAAIQAANNLANPNQIRTGQVLIIP